MTTALHQVVPVLSRRDATGHHTIEVQQLLREQGLQSEIFAVNTGGDAAGMAHPLADFDAKGGRGATLLYQCSVGSDAAAWCRDRTEPLVLDYHNMTPASYFDGWEPLLAASLRRGRLELAELMPRTTLAVADSRYNEAELVQLGYGRTAVASVILDLAAFDPPAHPFPPQARDDGTVEWLCVGRLVPNKGQHDLLVAFASWCAVTGRSGLLQLVGGGPAPGYEAALRRLAASLGIADRVRFAGSVGHAELVARYRAADVFVSLSEHEGFCVPVVEAMHVGLPVVAYAAAAVPETLGDAGLLLSSKRPLDVAAAVERILGDRTLHGALVARGQERAAAFDRDAGRQAFLAALAPVLGR